MVHSIFVTLLLSVSSCELKHVYFLLETTLLQFTQKCHCFEPNACYFHRNIFSSNLANEK